ncbi:MAG: SUMF1/EgtB/PvdO family nonheme iron enzyme [Nitrospira sp.]|nr:SUMF1/EgtB/PvdO family nonheme iron enzyme [Nitrospira sp.]
MLGSKRIDGDPYELEQFDDTELPQQPVWLMLEIVTEMRSVSGISVLPPAEDTRSFSELQKLIWHVITVHFVSDQTVTRWPALYVTWSEAQALGAAKHARLPTEAEWEKAARGPEGNPIHGAKPLPVPRWPCSDNIMHEIPILAARRVP